MRYESLGDGFVDTFIYDVYEFDLYVRYTPEETVFIKYENEVTDLGSMISISRLAFKDGLKREIIKCLAKHGWLYSP